MKYTLRTGHTFTSNGTLAAGNTLQAQGGATVIIQSGENDGVIALAGATPGQAAASLRITGELTNIGTIALADSAGGSAGSQGIIGTEGDLINQGVLIVGRGTIAHGIGATLTVAGTIDNLAGGTLQVGAPDTPFYPAATGSLLAVSGSFDNAGLLLLVANSSFRGTIPSTFALSGSMHNSGTIDIGIQRRASGGNYGTAPVLIDSGTLINSGRIYVAHGGGYGSAGTLGVSGTLINQSVIELSPGAGTAHYYPGHRASELVVTGVLANMGDLRVDGALGAASYSGAIVHDLGTITNSGTISAGAGSQFHVTGGLDSTGQMTFLGGSGGGSYLHLGLYRSPGALMEVFGTFSNEGTITLKGGVADAHSYYNPIGQGAHLRDFGVVTNTGLISLGGGRIKYSNPRYPNLHAGHGGTLIVSGTLSNIQQGGQTGTVELHAGYSSAGGIGTGAYLLDSGRLYNNGTLLTDRGTATAAGTLEIGAGGYLRNSGVLAGGGVLLNHGTIVADPATQNSIADVNFINDGVVIIGNGTISATTTIGAYLHADPGNQGAIFLDHATLTLAGRVAAPETFAFRHQDNLLVLGSPLAFGGTLSGLAASDTLDISGLNVTSVIASGTTLELGLAGGTTLDYALAAPLTGVGFGLHSDGFGGTDVILSAIPPPGG